MYKILVLPGDGIGPEVTREAVKVLKKVGGLAHLVFETTEADVGGASIDKNGIPITEDVIKQASDSDAVLLGAVGGPKWDELEHGKRPEQALLRLRTDLGLYANLRPATDALREPTIATEAFLASVWVLPMTHRSGGASSIAASAPG